MQDYSGKVAVVTGAAGGIGLAMAERFVREGMKVVLSDIDQPALQAQVERLAAQGHAVAAHVTDVTSESSVQALAEFASTHFGDVHLLCNNAGIGGGAADDKPLWEASMADWRWVFNINVWGVVHGIRAFVPRMQRHGQPAHIVNTASKAGLISGTGLYGASKHAVVAISEALLVQLECAKTRIGVSVLCPGAVNTQLAKNSERSRPQGVGAGEGASVPASAGDDGGADFMGAYRGTVQSRMAAGKAPSEMADLLIDGLRKGDFYILPGTLEDAPIEARLANIRARRVVDPRKSFPQFIVS